MKQMNKNKRNLLSRVVTEAAIKATENSDNSCLMIIIDEPEFPVELQRDKDE